MTDLLWRWGKRWYFSLRGSQTVLNGLSLLAIEMRKADFGGYEKRVVQIAMATKRQSCKSTVAI